MLGSFWKTIYSTTKRLWGPYSDYVCGSDGFQYALFRYRISNENTKHFLKNKLKLLQKDWWLVTKIVSNNSFSISRSCVCMNLMTIYLLEISITYLYRPWTYFLPYQVVYWDRRMNHKCSWELRTLSIILLLILLWVKNFKTLVCIVFYWSLTKIVV